MRGRDVRDLAAEYGTPLFVLDEDDFRARAAAFRDGVRRAADVFYAGKAFLSTTVARWVAEEGLGLDVCTGGELAVALRAGFPADAHRVARQQQDAWPSWRPPSTPASAGIVVDSFEEIARLGVRWPRSAASSADVLVRVTVGVEAHTHEFIATAHEDQKFGFSLARGDAAEAVRRVLELPELHLAGLHSHIGSQIFDTAGFEVAAHRVVGAGRRRSATSTASRSAELDLGGGMGIAYVARRRPAPTCGVRRPAARRSSRGSARAYGLRRPAPRRSSPGARSSARAC